MVIGTILPYNILDSQRRYGMRSVVR